MKQMKGTTDTEFLYALFLSLLKEDSGDGFEAALVKMMHLILESMNKLDAVKPTKLKLAFACQDQVVAVNYGSGFRGETSIRGDLEQLRNSEVGSKDFLLSTILEPLYELTGRDFERHEDYGVSACREEETNAAVLASEPLTDEDWLELEFGKMIFLRRRGERIETEVRSLDL